MTDWMIELLSVPVPVHVSVVPTIPGFGACWATWPTP